MPSMEPITRQERILAGEDIEPITRMEYFLKEAGSGGSGGLPPYDNSQKGLSLVLEQNITPVTLADSIAIQFVNGEALVPGVSLTGNDFSDGDKAYIDVSYNDRDYAFRNVPYIYSSSTYSEFWDNSAGVCLFWEEGTWKVSVDGITSGDASIYVSVDKQTGVAPAWSSPCPVIYVTDTSETMAALQTVIASALTAGDNLCHTLSNNIISSFSYEDAVNAVDSAVSSSSPLLINITGLGCFCATYFGKNMAGGSIQLSIPSYRVGTTYISIGLEYFWSSDYGANVYLNVSVQAKITATK